MKRKFSVIGGLILGIVIACGTILGYEIHQRSIAVSKKNSQGITQLTPREKLEDFDYVYDILKDNYPFFDINKRKTGFDWLANRGNFEKEIKETKNDEEFYYKMHEIFNAIQNSHTNILPASMLTYLQDISSNTSESDKVINVRHVAN